MSKLNAAPKYWSESKREAQLADFCSISAPVTEHDTITRSSEYIRVWKLEGVTFEAASDQTLGEHHEALCNLIRNLVGGKFAIHSYRIQRFVSDRLDDPSAPGFSRDFSRAYQASIGARPFLAKELYFALAYKPFATKMARNYGVHSRDLAAMSERQTSALNVMQETSTVVERALRAFAPRLLGVRQEGEAIFWEPGELFSFLLNGEWRPVRFPSGPVWQTLPEARVSVGGNKLELRTQRGTRYVAMLDAKEFDSVVVAGTLGALLYEEAEFIEAQSFATLARRQALASLITQRNQLISSGDVVASQIQAMDDALDGLGDGQFHMGEYSYSLAVFGDSVEQAGMRASKATGAVAETSAMQLLPIELLADAAWFAQLPGNLKWRPRRANISSRAFAALACNHNFFHGKRDGNPWGQALALMRTPSGQPMYLNLHASPPHQDSRGKTLPGNTLVIGSTGSGKTTILCALLALTRKWEVAPRLVSFSLDHDTEIIVRALGGQFYSFERNVPTGINPLQREPTNDRIGHWVALVKQCFDPRQIPLMPDDEEAIVRAVETVARMDRQNRSFTTIRQSLPRNGANSLYDRFGKWCRGGEYGWVFDEADDRLLDVHAHKVIGFDYTGIASNDAVRTIVMMELLHIMEELLDGTPLIYHVAEAWKALGDPIFSGFLKHQQKTIRKKNGLGIFDTQEVADLLSNGNGRTMVEQSVTRLILPNASATSADYVEGLGLTPTEFEVVRRLGAQGSRRFLCKQGIDSVECEFDLSGMDDMLTVLSSTLENVDLLTAIRAEVGDNPDDFLPILYQQARDARRGKRRSAA